MMMKISQLRPGFRVDEHHDDGQVTSFEVTQVRELGRKVEVTFRSMLGLESAVYMADAYLNARQ
ncbi:hypothetical protein [Paludibacterium purpuratum]|uniref:Uncharacterized protein n=1 Tax=Paludibacterium purpuratum TaxID=1144873 RepID=A0A4R7B851_9NEIS|nr:hypothetical protein [Paludibacterium purpuratum]TDR79955.1 hypothetical protein DFP86_10694 [Paludibacterium purpuratum]